MCAFDSSAKFRASIYASGYNKRQRAYRLKLTGKTMSGISNSILKMEKALRQYDDWVIKREGTIQKRVATRKANADAKPSSDSTALQELIASAAQAPTAVSPSV